MEMESYGRFGCFGPTPGDLTANMTPENKIKKNEIFGINKYARPLICIPVVNLSIFFSSSFFLFSLSFATH